MAKSLAKFLVIVLVMNVVLASCKPMSNAQRATKIAKKRYKYIKHDCNCHSYLYQVEDTAKIEG